jgi:hypothetical protein
MLTNIIVFAIVALMLAGAIVKIISDKKKGIKCSGCPHGSAGSDGCSCPSEKNVIS